MEKRDVPNEKLDIFVRRFCKQEKPMPEIIHALADLWDLDRDSTIIWLPNINDRCKLDARRAKVTQIWNNQALRVACIENGPATGVTGTRGADSETVFDIILLDYNGHPMEQ